MRTSSRYGFARTALLSSTTVVLAALFRPAAADCPQYIHTYPNGRAAAFYKPAFPDRPKDFAIAQAGSYYHLFYTRVDRTLPDASTTKDFGHAYTLDFKTWYPLDNVNPDGSYTNGVPVHPAWDAGHVWAPSVINVGSTYYMFFTGVDANGNQAIGVSTSPNLYTWSPHGGNPVLTCAQIPWAACPSSNAQLRDPYVMRDVVARDGSGTPGWLMYYTANPSSGQTAVGVAWASYNNLFVWNNLGGPGSSLSKLWVGPKTESPHVLQHGSAWYLFIAGMDGVGNHVEGYLTGSSPVGTSWSGPTWFPTVLDTTVAAGRSHLWFASEHLTVGSTDYLFYVHDYDPDACDPLCVPPPTPVGPSTIETRTINWNPGFAVADLAVTTDGSSWAQQCASTPPPARWGAAMIYDPIGDRIILHGGRSTAPNGSSPVYYGETWSFSPATRVWSQLATSGTPLPVANHDAMYDPLRQRILFLGQYFPQIYALSLSGTPTWSTVTTGPGIPTGDFFAAAIDPVHDRLYTVNQYDGVKKLELSTGVWSTIVNSTPLLPYEGTMVYDAIQNRLLFVGGWDETGALLCEAPARFPGRVRALNLNSPGGGWTSLGGPPDRYGTTASCDVAGNRLLVFGGVGWSDHCTCGTLCSRVRVETEVPFNDVWSMNLTTNAWTQRTPPPGTSPPGRGHHAAAYDPTREEITTFGGGEFHTDPASYDCFTDCTAADLYSYRNDTWTFRADGVPPAAVTLAAAGQCETVQITWLAPGDDGSTGTATLYDLRASQSPITPAIFHLATQIASFAPTGPAGTSESFTHQAGCGMATFHYALKTRDNAGNWSQMSNVPTGSTTCLCGGGGGCPFVHVLTKDGWKTENSVLGRSLDGGFVQDAYRIKATPSAVDGVYRLQIREDEQETTTLEQLRMVIVDHDPALRAFEVDGEVLLGRVTPAKRVTSGSGRDVTAALREGTFRGKPGDALMLEFPPSSAPADGGSTSWKRRLQQFLELEPIEKLSTRRNDLPLVRAGRSFDSFMLNQNGIRIDYEEGLDRWATISHRHPRELQDEMVVAVPASDRYRVTFVGEHGLAFAGRLEAVQPAEEREAVLLGAVHSRHGDVTAAVRAGDGRTTVLQRGERIDLSFRVPEPASGLARDVFVMSEGVYTNTPIPEADGLPTEYALSQNRPNPFGAETEIAFSLPRPERVRLEVFDPAGRRVAVIAQGSYPAGHHSVLWDRRDTERTLVKPGVYLYRLQAGRFETRRRLIVLP